MYINSAKDVIATFNSPQTTSYYHTDILGSVRAVTDVAGEPVVRHDYFPFGESTSSMIGDPRRYLGQERDAETGFDQFGARYFRNVWGRFTSVDPIFSTALTNPQRWNRYSYALNNPLRYVDPSGLDAEEEYGSAWDNDGFSHCSEICQEFDSWADSYVYENENIDGWLALQKRWAEEAAEKQRARDYEKRRNIENQMLATGLFPLMESYTWTGHMYEGRFSNTREVVAQLQGTGVFRGPGWAYGLHAAVGPDPQDYRSRGGSLGRGSMQVVFSAATRNFHIDVDKFSPYDGILSMLAHGALEVLPNFFVPSVCKTPVVVR